LEKNKSDELVKITFRIPRYKKEILERIATKEQLYVSDVVRAGIDKELNIKMFKDSLDLIVKEIGRIVDAKLDPFIKSQRVLNAKYTRSASINTYLLADVLERILADNYKEDFEYAIRVARQKANLYVNKRVAEKMSEEDILDYYKAGDIYRNE
jgi:hypothetical protein